MALEINKTYLINWGKGFSELHILEITASTVRATLIKGGKSTGAWYFKNELESRAVEQLD